MRMKIRTRLEGRASVAQICALMGCLLISPSLSTLSAALTYDLKTDWSDLNDYRVARWYKQLHIFIYPFYYIEYAIAQLGALQVWRNALANQEQAVADYRAALALGGSKPLPELFERAGARLIFDEAGMAELVALIQQHIAAAEDVTIN